MDVKQLEADANYFGLVGLQTFCAEAQVADGTEAICEAITDNSNTEAIGDAVLNSVESMMKK